ncbi:MAG: NAD-dependent succinate-semialdehyde dehydrogenase [Candidatus Eremiobacteraeota bacterium]|nr:NAD-dependent succinate-semialdehyde dehydrogenase [Candidatus Eremiobacteraeota bacterium]
MTITVDPSTEQELERFEPFDERRIDATLERARSGFGRWRRTPLDERSPAMRRAGALLRERKAELALLATREMGKPIAEAEAEVDKCAGCCDYFAEHAARFLADEPHPSSASESYVGFRPLGAILAVMPWNFPFWQVFRFGAPSLMAGNVGVLKHASNVTGCSLAIESIFRDAGFPDGVFSAVIVSGSQATKLIDDPRIAAVTLTGSEAAGVSVAAAAGKNLKKTVLELGGSDPFIVLADADLDLAADWAVRSRFQNTGQSCIAAKRFIVEDAVYDAFVERFAAKAHALAYGDPTDRSNKLGPLARGDLRDTLAEQIDATKARGGRVATGGRKPPRKGYFFEPTVVVDVLPGMPMFEQETFGPAAAVVRARDADHAVALANDSQFGLGGNLWTRDLERAKRLAADLETGGVFVNGMTASDPRLPFGGIKRSGYGRELSSFGIREFVNVQTVWIGPPKEPAPQSKPAE